jgi:probable phosphomutase (TIGR03848 family)
LLVILKLMPTILLIRHSENDYVKTRRLAGRLPGIHLNEKGQAQAQALAEKLANVPIKAIYSSPLERAMETARPVAAALHLEIIPCDGLMEINFGEWQGKTLKSLQRLKIWKTVLNSPSLMRFPGGETFANAQNRIINQIEELCQPYGPEDIFICVSHADVIRLAIAYYIGLPLDCFQRLHISPGSLNVLHISENRSGLFTLNYDPSFSFFTYNQK